MKYIRMTLFYFIALLIHWWWTTYGSVFELAPQILLVLTVAVAARRGPIPAMCFGFAWGLFMDLFSVHLLGMSSLSLTIIGYVVGSIRRQMDVASIAPQCVLVAVVSWAYFIFAGLLGLVFMKHFLWPGWKLFLLDPIYNCLLTPLLFWAWDVVVES